MKGFRITKNVKEIKFEGVRGKLESITITQENIIIENIIIVSRDNNSQNI